MLFYLFVLIWINYSVPWRQFRTRSSVNFGKCVIILIVFVFSFIFFVFSLTLYVLSNPQSLPSPPFLHLSFPFHFIRLTLWSSSYTQSLPDSLFRYISLSFPNICLTFCECIFQNSAETGKKLYQLQEFVIAFWLFVITS